MEESTKLVDESTEALWYVVHTYSGYENKVANDLQTMVENRHLQDLICDIKVPVEMVPEIDKNGKQKMVEHKLFPGYVLVKMVMNDYVLSGSPIDEGKYVTGIGRFEGARIIKWPYQTDGTLSSYRISMENDFYLMRYSDVVL